MTRKQWRNLSIGDSVKITLPWPDHKVTILSKQLTGEVLQPNQNRSLVLVKWENIDEAFWYERTMIAVA